jgi:outer membrane protein assembly factor BamA
VRKALIKDVLFAKFARSNNQVLNKNILKISIIVVVVMLLFSGCAVKKYIPEDNSLVNKYFIQIENKPEEISTADLRSFLRPRPNKKILGIRFKLHHYYRGRVKPTKFNKWKAKNFGEEPVYFEEEHVERLAKKMEGYLDNIGFFHSRVWFDVSHVDKLSNVTFKIKPTTPYRIKKITYDIRDTVLAGYFNRKTDKTLIKEGDIYNAYTFDDERDRITADLRNVGYFYFTRNYIQFIVDSSFTDHSMTVELKINNLRKQAPGAPDDYVEVPHKRYFIKNVHVIPDWRPFDNIVYDTVPHRIKFWNDTNTYIYDFYLDEVRRIKPKAFNSTIRIKPGQAYSAKDLQDTYRRIYNFSIIRSAKISFDTAGAGSSEDGSYHYLNSRIQMQTSKLNTFRAQLEGTNSSGDLGLRGTVGVANKNIFRRGEVFSITVNGGFEAQSVFSKNDTLNQTDGIFNTAEAGFQATILFPRFLFPFRLTKFHQRYNPTTTVNFGFNYQMRPSYRRTITNLDLGYSWNQNIKIRHLFNLINLNYVNIFDETDAFNDWLDDQENQRLREQYADHFIAGMQYSFIFNDQNLTNRRNFNYFRMNLETAGNLLNGLSQWFGSTDTSFYKVGGVRFAQYVRSSFDFRHFFFFAGRSNSIAVRFLFGIAVPYGNSNQIPYEKGFFAGGANDMRGWQFRQLGPGGTPQETTGLERVGDIQIETNIEYRFPIYKFLKGAFFVDVGNIWTLRDDEAYPDGQFEWNSWYRQLAMDAGVGVRFDFQFFIFRVDVAVPFVDPQYWNTTDPREYWNVFNGTVFNFGIGYPF